MGSVKIDTSKNEKRLYEAYPLDKANGVQTLFSNIYHVQEKRYIRGDYDASIMLIDFHRSVIATQLTDRQKQVLRLVFVQELTQQEVGRLLKITQQAVSDHVNTAIRKIAALNAEREATGTDG